MKAERVPYFSETAINLFRDTDLLILVGATSPVSLFASPDKPSWPTPERCDILVLSHEHEDGVSALEAVAEAIGAPIVPAGVAELVASLPTGESLTAETVAQIVAYHLPENAIIIDETVSSGHSLHPITATARPHDHLTVSGGSIGWALAAATGAAVACPGRRAVCLHGDGGAAMALQALWTQSRENLDATTVIYSNRSYAVLNIEMVRAGFDALGPMGKSLFDLSRPSLDWVKLAEGMGVEASRAESVGAFSDQFASAVRATGPRLIEASI